MNKNDADKISRRKFIEKSVWGTGILIAGSQIGGLAKAESLMFSRNYRNLNPSAGEGVFPFYKYAGDYNFGEYIPKDQGGKFIQMELLGTEKDEKITEIINTAFIDEHLGVPNDWSIFEKTALEKSVWFNRFYYLPSFARMYYLSGKKEYLGFMMNLLKNWIKENPVAGPSKSKYNWFDMQVAWRSINLSWCYYLAKEGLSDEDKEIIRGLQGQHAKILMKDFGKKELNEFNHQSHGALAILYLAILFPSLPEAEELLQTGIKIIRHHVEKAFYPDGGNVEQMFGYYPFMTSVFRDAYLLYKANNVGDPDQILPLLKKMYGYLKLVAQPDETVPPINDSYEETTKYVLSTLEDIVGEKELPEIPGSASLDDSRVAIIRSDSDAGKAWYISLNAAKLIGSHDHAGRLAFNFWFNDKPVMVDSGCCNYDNPLLVDWYRTSEAHNTVLIDGKSDVATSQRDVQWAAKRYTDNIISDFIVNPEYKLCRMVSPASDETNSGVKWTRDVALVLDKYLLIHDCFESTGNHKYDTIFRYADLKLKQVESSGKLLINTGDKLVLVPVTEDETLSVELKEDYFGSHAKNIKTPTSVFKTDGSGIVHSAFLLMPIGCEDEIDKINISNKIDGLNCMIELKDECGENIRININNGEVEGNQIFSLTKI